MLFGSSGGVVGSDPTGCIFDGFDGAGYTDADDDPPGAGRVGGQAMADAATANRTATINPNRTRMRIMMCLPSGLASE